MRHAAACDQKSRVTAGHRKQNGSSPHRPLHAAGIRSERRVSLIACTTTTHSAIDCRSIPSACLPVALANSRRKTPLSTSAPSEIGAPGVKSNSSFQAGCGQLYGQPTHAERRSNEFPSAPRAIRKAATDALMSCAKQPI